MAITISDKIRSGTIVGALVYEAYTPARCGKVIADLGAIGSGYFHKLRVRYIKGEEKDIDSGQLKNFEELVEEHKRKYERHASTLEKLKLL